MKKNLISVLILALVFANFVLTAILMFSVLPETKKANTLIEKVWGNDGEFVDENALSVTIKRLRDKLEKDPRKPEYIQTVYGIGYRFQINEGESQ